MTETPDQSRIPALIADLRKVAPFADQPEEDLEWFISQSEYRETPIGEITIHEDTVADHMIVVLDGEVRARRESGPADGPTFTARAGDVTGLLPFSRMKKYTVTGRAMKPSRGLYFPSILFSELFHRMPELAGRLVGLLTDRVRDFTRTQEQYEKLAALGKLSAGLAHELNNPSAAARRSAGALRECLQRLREAARNTTMGPDDCALVAKREEEIRLSLKPVVFKDEFARVEREEAIQAWLESHGIEDGWKLAPLIADANLQDDHLESFAKAAGASLGPELTRFATLLEMDHIAEEMEVSTSRISDLIKAIKEYSYMDQSPVQDVDIINSLETTLKIMHHKLKRGIVVVRDYAPDLPKVMTNGGELNQVWTNLIDNAADAMNEKGTLTVRAVRDNDYVLVEIIDNGPGIPAEIQSRIYEPFFTTKPMGQGTGMGLDLVYRIVKQIRGLLTLKSVPGHTSFQVRIPLPEKK
jgi:signal transduction histidine kinase